MLVPVTVIPVSLIGAVFIMQVFGFSLNLLTLLAIVLSAGLVVDDAIVLIFLALAVQFNSFRDPLIILADSVPLAMFGALVFTSLKMPNPNIPCTAFAVCAHCA